MRRLSGRFTGGGRLREWNHRGFLPRRSLNTSNLRKGIYCMQFPSYDMCSSISLLKFFLYSKEDSAHRDNKKAEKSLSGRLQEVKNNRKSLNRQSQIVVAVAYRW